jgi:hypothetical protein
MATFGLVHGGGLGAWSWDLVRPLIEQQGHSVVALELPLATAGLGECADLGARGLEGVPGPLIVVGHALGCTVLPLIASRANADLMIWVCGMIPVAGQSAAGQIELDPTMVPMYRDRDPETGALPQNAFVESLVHDCEPDVRQWAAERLVVAPPGDGRTTVVTEIFPDMGLRDIPSVYILTVDDRALAAPQARAAAHSLLGVTPVELPGGHCPIFSRPRELFAILEEVTDKVGGSGMGAPTSS